MIDRLEWAKRFEIGVFPAVGSKIPNSRKIRIQDLTRVIFYHTW